MFAQSLSAPKRTTGVSKANSWVDKFIPNGLNVILISSGQDISGGWLMLTNYKQKALLSYFKRKGSAYLNLLGLVIGISCCLLNFQYVSYERSYDRFEPAASDTYRLRLDQFKEGKLEWQSATVYPAIAPTLKRDYPEVVNFCRLFNWSQVFNDPTSSVKFSETKGYVADPSAVPMLGVQLVSGSSFSEPYQMIVSETMARRYFGTTDAVGRRLVVRSRRCRRQPSLCDQWSFQRLSPQCASRPQLPGFLRFLRSLYACGGRHDQCRQYVLWLVRLLCVRAAPARHQL